MKARIQTFPVRIGEFSIKVPFRSTVLGINPDKEIIIQVTNEEREETRVFLAVNIGEEYDPRALRFLGCTSNSFTYVFEKTHPATWGESSYSPEEKIPKLKAKVTKHEPIQLSKLENPTKYEDRKD